MKVELLVFFICWTLKICQVGGDVALQLLYSCVVVVVVVVVVVALL